MVKGVQGLQEQAAQKLYEQFRGLIKNEIRAENVQAALGQDAENTAWEIFYSFIHGYKGDDFKHLPGLIKKHVHFKLLHKLHQEGCLYDCEHIDTQKDDDISRQYIDPQNHIASSEQSMLLSNALNQLPDKQRDVIDDLYFQGLSLRECRLKRNCHRNNIYKQQQNALANLKKLLN